MRRVSDRNEPVSPLASTHPHTSGDHSSVPSARCCSPFLRYIGPVPKWCTVTVTDGEGKRYSLDIQADSSFDAAHLYLTHVKANPACGFPIPTTETLFEVVIDGRVHRVQGLRLKGWIEKKRHEFGGPRGYLFSQRPMIGS
jgi:hypothetical protein